MTSQNGYVVHAGSYAPQKVTVAHVDKKGNIQDNSKLEVYKQIGVNLLINRYSAWGRRVFKKNVGANSVISKEADKDTEIPLNGSGYEGHIEFLEWGDARGYAIECRYLKQSRSLDYEYQENVQKIKIAENSGTAFIELQNGENQFDYKKDALLIYYLQNHPQNRNSKSKNTNPEIAGHSFYQKEDSESDKLAIENMENVLTAGGIVKSYSNNSDDIKNLFDLLSGYKVNFGDVTRLSSDTDIYRAVLQYAQTNPSGFIYLVDLFKKEFSDAVELAKSFNALDTKKEGCVGLLLNNKNTLVFEKVEGKGEAMITSIFNNFAKNGIYQSIITFNGLTNKLKTT